MDANNVEFRLPVWEALSDLFLDTELDEHDFVRIASRLAESPYCTNQIEEILRFEVFPKLKWNLTCIAGEWAGFNREWLVEVLQPMIGRRKRFFLPSPVWRMITNDRERIFAQLRQMRGE